jgi:Na+/H+ antiporter NhaD/arsenite permease-like protein
MHQSGGQLTIIGWVVTIIIAVIFTVGFIADILKSRDISTVISGVCSLLVVGYVLYKLHDRFKK